MIEKKPYETPQMKVFQVKLANIIATSGTGVTERLTEENFDWN